MTVFGDISKNRRKLNQTKPSMTRFVVCPPGCLSTYLPAPASPSNCPRVCLPAGLAHHNTVAGLPAACPCEVGVAFVRLNTHWSNIRVRSVCPLPFSGSGCVACRKVHFFSVGFNNNFFSGSFSLRSSMVATLKGDARN